MKIKKNIKKLGHFWIPSNPDNKLAGLICIEDGGAIIRVELLGLFNMDWHEQLKQFSIDILLGDIEEYGNITLIDSYYPQAKRGGRNKYKNIIESDYVFIGSHFYTKDELVFNDFIFRIEGLNDWFGISGINIDLDDSDYVSAIISYDKPKDITVKIDKNINLNVTFRDTQTIMLGLNSSNDHAEIRQDTYLEILSDGNIPFLKLFNLGKRIANFFIFAINKEVSIEKIMVHKVGLYKKCIDGKNTDIQTDIQVFTNQILSSKNVGEVNYHNMIFAYNDSDNFDLMINRWLDIYNVIDPSLDLYFSVIFSKDKYMKSHFLMLVQALEALYRRVNDNHEISFKHILNEMSKDFIEMDVYTDDQMKTFSENIKNTRNYLTHYKKALKNKSLADDEYLKYINTIKFLLQIHFLKLLGFDLENICDFLNLRFKYKGKNDH